MPAPEQQLIFSDRARRAKRQRAGRPSPGADFAHVAAADDIVDRLETVLRPFTNTLLCGPGAQHVWAARTEAAGIENATFCDDLTFGPDTVEAVPSKLPFADNRFDLVVSSMALHGINDTPGSLGEIRRVLVPDGLFIATFPGERTLHELRGVLQDAEAQVTGKVAPRVAPQIAVRDAGGLLQHAGFALPVADVQHLAISYADVFGLVSDLRALGETNALATAAKGALRRDVFARACAMYADRHSDSEGRLKATLDLITITGWKPDASQPKPLKPGSAKISLAKVLSASGDEPA